MEVLTGLAVIFSIVMFMIKVGRRDLTLPIDRVNALFRYGNLVPKQEDSEIETLVVSRMQRQLGTICGGITRSYRKDENLTRWEIHYMIWLSDTERPNCVDCEAGELDIDAVITAVREEQDNVLLRPSWYCCTNRECGSQFRISPWKNIVRLSIPSPNAKQAIRTFRTSIYR
jgi:hypothetical protein